MFELFKNEFMRFKKWLLITVTLNTLFILMGIYMDDYEHSGQAVGVGFSILYGINAWLLGAAQMKTYRPINMWTYLINRPVKTQQIFISLCGAGTLILLVSLVLPYLLLTLVVDVIGLYIIDGRHYLQATYMFLIALNFYLSACYITLSSHKTAYAVMIFPLLIISSLLSNGPIIAISLLSAVWLLLLVMGAFQANLESRTLSAGKMAGIAIPFHLMAFLVLSAAVAFGSQVYLMLVDGAGIRVAWNYYFDTDTYNHAGYLDSDEQVILGLEQAADAAYYQRQVAVSKAYNINAELDHFPWHQQLPYLQNYQQLRMADPSNDMKWIFSHDSMSFLGRQENASRGQLDPPLTGQVSDNSVAKVKFNEVPVVLGQQVFTAQKLYFYDPYLQQLVLKISLPDNESILSRLDRKGHHFTLLTTAALYLYDPLKVENTDGLVEPLIRIPLPQAYENLSTIQIAELMDSHLISFLYGELSDQGLFPAEQITLQLSNSYEMTQLAQKPLRQGFNEYYRYRGYYLSPLWYVIDQALINPVTQAKPPQPQKRWRPVQLSTNILGSMVLLSLLSVSLTFLILRKRRITNKQRYAHLALTTVTSLSGLLFCWLFYPKKEQPVKA